MNLQDLIDELTNLTPASARSSAVRFKHGDVEDFELKSVRYEGGETVVEIEEAQKETDD